MGLFQYRVEHRREVTRRGVDDLQYVGSRGLLRQRLARLGQEPGVLHRDDGLCGEVLEQRDLLVSEWTDFLAKCGNRAKHCTIFPKRYYQQRSRAAKLDEALIPFAFRHAVCRDIGDVDKLAASHARPRGIVVPQRHPTQLTPIFCKLRFPMNRHCSIPVTIEHQQAAHRGAAKCMGLLQDRIEYRGEVAGGGIYDLQYPSGGSLAGKRLVELLTQLRVGTPKFSDLVVG